jgi:hypothetical protein
MAAKAVRRSEVEEVLHRLQLTLLEGARISVTEIQAFPATGPVVADLDRPATISFDVTVDEVISLLAGGGDRRALLVLAVDQVESGEDFVVHVFLNQTAATADTPVTPPHFAASFAFFCVGEGPDGVIFCPSPDDPALSYEFDVSTSVRAVDAAGQGNEDVTATLVLVPFADREPRNRQMSVRAARLQISRFVVRPRS